MSAAGAPRRVAVIDLGSNTAKLIALAYRPGHGYRHLDQLRDVVRLSEGMGPGRVLRAEAMDRALATLATFRAYCDAAGIDEVVATATSAVRDAVNGDAFVARARREAGIELRVLSGEEEARYGVLAVANSSAAPDALVLDLGGGSVQLSEMRARRSEAGRSWPLGAVRATERFLTADPPKKKQLRALRAEVDDAIGPWLEARAERAGADGRAGPSELPWIGMGGTLRNLANAWQHRVGHPLDLLHGYRLPAEGLATLAEELADTDTAGRRKVSGLNADRADIVVAGAAVIERIARLAGVEALTVSGQGLREGVFYPLLFPDAPGHLAPDVRDFSARNLMRLYHDDEAHPERVAALALALFDAFAEELGHGPAERELLAAAARVHDVGMAIDYYGHHRHGAYLVLARPLPGFDPREQALIALLVRWHRKGGPDAGDLAPLLGSGDDVRLRDLTAMLRTAEQLERSKSGRVAGVRCHLGPAVAQVEVHARGDARLELQEAAARSDLLAEALGRPVEFVPAPVPA
jgi:exopolyphosphatase/guanosine-5'-triphosphate,3'-diphosphate pyrophosphatase